LHLSLLSNVRSRCRGIRPFLVTAILLVSASSVSRSNAQQRDAAAAIPAIQSARDEERPYWRTNLFGRFFRDQKYLFTTWWSSEFRRPGFTAPLVAGIALASTSTWSSGEGPDLELEEYIHDESRGRAKSPARVLSDLGDGLTGAFLIGSG